MTRLLFRVLAAARARLQRGQRAELASAIRTLKDDVSAARGAAKATRAKAARLERQLPAADALAALLPARHAALLRSPRAGDAAERERRFAARTPLYQEVKRAPLPAATTTLHSHGLALAMPSGAAASGSLGRRLREGWLPFDDIARARDVALGHVVLDIGAHIGTTALPRVILGDAQLVLAAEPEAVNYACLVHNIVANGLAGFVLPERVALSDTEGEAWLVNSTGMATHYLSLRRDASESPSPVRTTTIDAWLRRHDVAPEDVGFVKCDTQGWEPRVLDGAAALLAQAHVVWQVELHPGLLHRSGTTPAAFVARLAASFTHFIDVNGAGQRVRSTADLMASLEYLLDRRERPFTDLLLFGGHAA